jgi:hypothetical protein
MAGRYCVHCKRQGGSGPRELRPYGPDGADVCAECILGPGAPPEREATAKQELGKRHMYPGTLLLDPTEQVGPRPLLKRGRRAN